MEYRKCHLKTAERLFNKGTPVYLCPSKAKPHDGVFSLAVKIEPENGSDFEKLVNAFRYYNCNSETGKNVSFYITVPGGA